ncbi:MAG: Coenzyme F420 hydrogenase/dehydrogenase, beta subunit C-terminal domain [Methanobacterium paludis]|nr:Coenzyme F420 hydrogenase/dehydrogenase, beta subunit C-terminal domain [Methanobacterium paludis]
MNVIESVVKNDYCIGCGVCAGICPSKNLHMDWSNQGELIPHTNDSCKDNCFICLDVCPFYDHNINQDDVASNLFSEIPNINYNKYTGYYTDCYVGHKKNDKKRLKSASGGAATSFLSSLLTENIVDKVVAVGTFETPERMFEFKILNNPEDVDYCAGSAYYPVEISGVLKEILKDKTNATYAVIALPCVVFSLRLAMKNIPKLKRKIKLIASLTCGQLQNRFGTEFLALESGITVGKLSKMDFRRKFKGNIASNYFQVAIDKEGKEGIQLPNQKLPFHVWYYQYFKENACNFCDDIFGEVADVTFMDAWLPEYVNNYRGTSLVIARTSLVKTLLKNSEEFHLNEINIKRVIESQMGVIQNKRVLLRGKLYKKERSIFVTITNKHNGF